MKDFIELTLATNDQPILIAISSISFVEQSINNLTRIVLKESIEGSGLNIVFPIKNPLADVKDLIKAAQAV